VLTRTTMHPPVPNRPTPTPVKHPRYPWHVKPKEKQMTIAAGFVERDGVVLCTDSLYSGGVKVHGKKIFRLP
jgi:hypothetical protein